MKKVLSTLFTLPALFLSTSLFAEGEGGAAPAKQQNLWQTFIVLGIAIVFFYLILWRPEKKRRKAMAQKRESLKKGDRVTAMGIIGTVIRISDETIILKMFDGSKIEFVKGAISEVQPGTEEDVKRIEKEEPNA